MHDATIQILYPERKIVNPGWVIRQAQDYLATEYMRENPGVDEASGAIEANSKVHSLEEAKEILSDAGIVTFARG